MSKLKRFLVTENFFIAFGFLTLFVDICTTFSTTALAYGVLGLFLIVGVVLLISEDLMPVVLCSLSTGLVASRCYDAVNIFLKAPLIYFTVVIGLFVIGALTYNLIRYRRKFVLGRSIKGILAVSFAVTVGGIGNISTGDYFSVFYYVFFLGLGMVGLYLLLKSRFYEREEYNIRKKFASVLCVIGILAVALTLKSFITDIDTIIETGDVPNWRFRNNFSTFMMIAMPAPLMFARKKRWMLAIPPLIYAAMILLGSRGGLIMGAVELLCCLIFMSVADRKFRWAYIGIMVGFAIIFAFCTEFISDYFSSRTGGGLIDSSEQRVRLLVRSFVDFYDAPVFGQGLGYKGNFDIYKPKAGAMGWYHMMIPQIIGSMGMVGIIAYGYQFLNRIRIVMHTRRYDGWVLFVCYMGLLLMSQVNPGVFCPLPYELIAVMIFIFIEDASEPQKWEFIEPPETEEDKIKSIF